jgi:hypothetical protein
MMWSMMARMADAVVSEPPRLFGMVSHKMEEIWVA